MATIILDKEYEVYNKNKERLASESADKFVLIKGEEIVDTYTSYEDALKAGLKQFGNVPFFIRQIEYPEEVHFFFTGVAL